MRKQLNYTVLFQLYKKYFCTIAFAREKSKLVSLNAIITGKSKPFANVAIETPPVITVDVIRPVFTMLVIVLNRFIFFARLS